MMEDALDELHIQLKDFNHVIVLGDRHEDKGLAENINAHFIDVREKKYNELIHEYEIKRKTKQ